MFGLLNNRLDQVQKSNWLQHRLFIGFKSCPVFQVKMLLDDLIIEAYLTEEVA